MRPGHLAKVMFDMPCRRQHQRSFGIVPGALFPAVSRCDVAVAVTAELIVNQCCQMLAPVVYRVQSDGALVLQ